MDIYDYLSSGWRRESYCEQGAWHACIKFSHFLKRQQERGQLDMHVMLNFISKWGAGQNRSLYVTLYIFLAWQKECTRSRLTSLLEKQTAFVLWLLSSLTSSSFRGILYMKIFRKTPKVRDCLDAFSCKQQQRTWKWRQKPQVFLDPSRKSMKMVRVERTQLMKKPNWTLGNERNYWRNEITQECTTARSLGG